MKFSGFNKRCLGYIALISLGIIGLIFLSRGFYAFIFSQPEGSCGSVLRKAKGYLLDGYPEKAADVYERFLVLNPDNTEAILNLAIIYDDYLEDNEKAVKLYKRFLELSSGKEIKSMVVKWMRESANQALKGRENTGGESAYSRMKKEIKQLLQENRNLKKQVERLSGKLYKIGEEHQKEIEQLQAERDRLVSALSSARVRIGKLLEELETSERSRKELQKKLESREEWDFKNNTTPSR